MHDTELISQDILAYLDQHQRKELLRFVTVGSVDDGKSTLIGRLLHDTQGVYEDQLSAVKRASSRAGLEIDFSLFTDGLKAEREQGITIDVAYRYFSTAKRKFIIADTPGHVQYTRNMATGASTADVAIILIDARLGVLQQSRRHAYIGSLLGIPNLTVCINKMDLEGYESEVFDRIRREFSDFCAPLGFQGLTFIPVSALKGDNVVHRSAGMPWYTGPTLLEHLETVPVAANMNRKDFRFPVQIVLRPDLDYRGFSGTIASGIIRKGDTVQVLPSGKTTRIAAIDSFDGELALAHAPMSVTLRLSEEIDISRGDMLVRPDNRPNVGRRFDAMLVWMSERSLDRKKSYLLKHTTQVVRAEIEEVSFTTDLETLNQQPASGLELNDIGRVTISCHRPLFYDAYTTNRGTGAFILIDSLTNNTVAAGMILPGEAAGRSALLSSSALDRPHSQVSPEERSERLGQKGCTVWLTGTPEAGTSALAFALERRLFDLQKLAVVVDPADAAARSGQAGGGPAHAPELARRFSDAGLISIFPLASPGESERDAVRASVGAERFLEVLVESGQDGGAQRRAPAPFGDLTVSVERADAEQTADRVVELLVTRGLLPA